MASRSARRLASVLAACRSRSASESLRQAARSASQASFQANLNSANECIEVGDGVLLDGLGVRLASSCPHPGPAVMRASNHLAVVCLFFGVVFAAFLSGSLEQRIGNLFSFGLLSAISFYAGGHVLGQLLVFGVELCDLCFRYAVHLISDVLSWAGTHLSNLTGGLRTKRSQRN